MWKNVGRIALTGKTRGILVEVERVKAHRTKKEKEKMTQFEMFEGNEEADDLAKAGAMLDEGLKQEQKRCSKKERRCMQHCSMRPASIAW